MKTVLCSQRDAWRPIVDRGCTQAGGRGRRPLRPGRARRAGPEPAWSSTTTPSSTPLRRASTWPCASSAAEGIEADGEVGDPDPYTATIDAVREYHPDEIIISTYPETRSGWLRRDLIDRVRDASGVPVEHVVTDPDTEGLPFKVTLAVANRTASGDELLQALQAKAQSDAGGPAARVHRDRAPGGRERLCDPPGPDSASARCEPAARATTCSPPG